MLEKKITRDPWVLEVQQWLNETYKGQSGYNEVDEDGYTGWKTIYGLIRALQIELGLSPADNFGEGTKTQWNSQVTSKLVLGWEHNIVQLIDGANRCKGIGNGKFSNVYTEENISTLKSFKEMAGFESPNSQFDAIWAKALFDMSAFSLVPTGDATIREIQQYLNRNYYSYTGILPCDGIYQRNTNTAIIYGLQAEIGMDPGTANGNYGPGTEAGTPTLQVGDTGAFVTILQMGLYVNGFNKGGDFSGNFTSGIGQEVQSFREFMVLPPYNQISDLTVMKGLLTSNGNTNRSATACDTSTILTSDSATDLKNAGYEIVGRYLTGTVGVGEDERDKSLSFEEITAITSAGLSIFPIYQDGGWYEGYFTESQGRSDAEIAVTTAMKFGFPFGTTIYFACDVDIQDGNINGTVLEYFKGINQYMSEVGYFKVGVYGTRNVCQRMVDSMYAESCFVSNMSSGFSGNLGYPMPPTWAFDQFIEVSESGIGIDKVAVSGKDKGVNKFTQTPKDFAKRDLINIMNKFANGGIKKDRGFFSDMNFEWDHTYQISPTYNYWLFVTPHFEWELDTGENISVNITNGKAELETILNPIEEALDFYDNFTGSNSDFENLINQFSPTVGNGMINVRPSVRDGMLGVQILLSFEKSYETEAGTMTAKYQLKIEIYPRPLIESPLPNPEYDRIVQEVSEGTYKISNLTFFGMFIGGISIAVLFFFGGAIISAIGAFVAGIGTTVALAAKTLTIAFLSVFALTGAK